MAIAYSAAVKILRFLPLFLCPLLACCGGDPAARTLKAGEKPVIIASTLHIACIATAVSGDDAKVELLPPDQTDPHDFEPTANDRRRLQAAHLFAVSGLGLEGYDAAKLAEAAGVTLVDCGANVPARFLIGADGESGHDHHHHGHGDDHGHAHGPSDPHVWLSAEGASKLGFAIAQALGKLDVAHAQAYTDRALAFSTRLFQTLDEFAPKIEKLANKKFATDHDAFAYFAREAGLGKATFIRKTPGRQITVEQRRKLEEELRAAGVRAIFIEPGHENTAAEEVAKSLGVKLAMLDPFEIGKFEPGALEQNYRKNLEAVLKALSD